MDIIALLGGYKTAIMTILTSLSPVFFIIFMVKLTQIIRTSYKNEYCNELNYTILSTVEKLKSDPDFNDYLKSYGNSIEFSKIKKQMKDLPPASQKFDNLSLRSEEIVKLERLASKVL